MEEALREYDHCARKVFVFRNKTWTIMTEKFHASALKEIVEDLVRRRKMGEYLQDRDWSHGTKGQFFVCTLPASKVGDKPRRLRPFFGSETDYDDKVKIREAAQATTAAYYCFKPMEIQLEEQYSEECIDAAIGCNQPVEHLLQEAADQFGTGRWLGTHISIGTGTRSSKIGRVSTGLKTIFYLPGWAKELFGTLKQKETDAEKPHHNVEVKVYRHLDAYFRLYVPDATELVGLNKYRKMRDLKIATEYYLSHGIHKAQVILLTLELQSMGDISHFFKAREDILAKLDDCFLARDTR
ncbi:hypothetical protein N0V88_004662 [Collariella sp. IMI 366227]|nr:hypothetical protein N0V88_004662 [Collariella sp. IMI 366227]